MKYIVTGGAGFIGSNLVDKLILNGHEVHILDNFSTGKKENCNSEASYHELDICNLKNSEQITKIMSDADSVFHMAALARVQPSILNPLKYELHNTIGTMNILKSSVDAGVKRVVYSASSSAYGNPMELPSKNVIQQIRFLHMQLKSTTEKCVVKCFQKCIILKRFLFDILMFMEKNKTLEEHTLLLLGYL